jgi:hypothetical protein
LEHITAEGPRSLGVFGIDDGVYTGDHDAYFGSADAPTPSYNLAVDAAAIRRIPLTTPRRGLPS